MPIFRKKYKKGDMVKIIAKGSKGLASDYNNKTAQVHRSMGDGFYEVKIQNDGVIIVVLSSNIKSI